MQKTPNKYTVQPFGNCKGKEVFLFRLENIRGNYVELTNYGAIVKSIVVPDRKGRQGNVVLAYPILQRYLEDNSYMGATVGRFANRIANAAFELGGKRYELHKNDGRHNNHAGFTGFNSQVFEYTIEEDTLLFSLFSPDGDGGFPGNLNVTVAYRWTDDNELHIHYSAESDWPTPVNLTNHSYFNLSAGSDKIYGHTLGINADRILEATADYIPTGKIVAAADREFSGQAVGEKISSGKGINSYYILHKDNNPDRPDSELFDPGSGRLMQVKTSYPGIQCYTADFLSSNKPGSHGKSFTPFDGICLECQYYPDSPNHPHFPNTILKPGTTYDETISFKFSVRP